MKKVIVLSALSLALISGAATASTGDIRFIGSVTDTTCNITPVVNGAVNNMINLGTAAINTESATPVNFALKSDGAGGCSGLDDTKTVNITFTGPLTDAGLGQQGGSATGAVVQIAAKNTKADASKDVVITAGDNTRVFAGDKLKTAAADGAMFQATLKGGATAGDFQSAVAFAVAYM